MDPTTIAAIVCLSVSVVLCVGTLAVTMREGRRQQQRLEVMSKALDLANAALAADTTKPGPGFMQMAEVDPDTPLGRELIKAFGLDQPCQCPNCDEARRIAHAESKRDEL